jgi:Flp pilus assembly pilin Flp
MSDAFALSVRWRPWRLSDREPQDAGASAVEYSLLIMAIAAVIIVIVVAFGGAVQGLYKQTCDTIDGQVQVSSSCSTT